MEEEVLLQLAVHQHMGNPHQRTHDVSMESVGDDKLCRGENLEPVHRLGPVPLTLPLLVGELDLGAVGTCVLFVVEVWRLDVSPVIL